jgi:hypothetical protein
LVPKHTRPQKERSKKYGTDSARQIWFFPMIVKKTARPITSRPGASRLYVSRVVKLLTLTLFCCLLASCAAQQIKQREAFVNHYSQGNYQAAYQEALSRGQIKENGVSKDLLWSLNAGSSAFFTGQYGCLSPLKLSHYCGSMREVLGWAGSDIRMRIV